MFRILCAAVILGTIAGCATTISSQREDISRKYVGAHSDVPIKAFGIPSREINAAGRKAYEWVIGAGDCKMTMEVTQQETIKDVRLSGYVESCESYTR